MLLKYHLLKTPPKLYPFLIFLSTGQINKLLKIIKSGIKYISSTKKPIGLNTKSIFNNPITPINLIILFVNFNFKINDLLNRTIPNDKNNIKNPDLIYPNQLLQVPIDAK